MSYFLSLSALRRRDHGFYPIFSIRTDRKDLLEEFQKTLTENQITCTEIYLPGVSHPEIGFAIPRNQQKSLMEILNPTGEISELGEHYAGWLLSPHNTPVPEQVDIPADCLNPLKSAISMLLNIQGGPTQIKVLNTKTGQELEVNLDYLQRTSDLPEEAEAWMYWCIL